MLKSIFSLLLLMLPFSTTLMEKSERPTEPVADGAYALFLKTGMYEYVSFRAFEQAYTGYETIPARKKNILTLIDFSKPSTQERFYLLDMEAGELLLKSHVAHGVNSGELYATEFSNISGSYQSSLGFYITESTYHGKNGRSLRLNGLEKGINDKVKDRVIVVHSADYANPEVIDSLGRLGHSQGCPALPEAICQEVIDLIKEGSLMYVYADDPTYLTASNLF